jgi:hypothetical protein
MRGSGLFRAACCLVYTLTACAAQAQGRGGQNWTTANSDAQRTSAMRADPRISRESLQKPGLFQFIWKTKLENQARQMNSLTQALLLNNIISYKGFKALAFIGGSADNVWSIDYELNRMFWSRHLTSSAPTSGTAQCPGGLTAISRPTPLVQPGVPGRGTPPPAPPPAPARGAPPTGPGGINIGMNLLNAIYAVASDGMVHVLNPQTGEDLSPPTRFLAANAKVAGSVFVDGVLYAATADNCGNVPSGVWAIALGNEAKSIAKWTTKGGSVVGRAAPTLGADGTVYAATTDGDVVALQAGSLAQKDSYTAAAPFTTAPVALSYRDRQLLVAANKDGHLYVFDGASLKAPLSTSTQVLVTAPDSSLASWEESDGTRWILAASTEPGTTGSVVAFKLIDQNGMPTLQQAWKSREINLPASPIVINGVVFALASGGPRAGSAVLYALDGTTGKELWSSGTTMTSFVHSGGLSGADGQVYVPTYDNTLYAFGIPLEH